MKRINDLSEITEDCAIVFGNFDGVHLGHQEMIRSCQKKCEGMPLIIYTFFPHPLIFFKKEEVSFLISSKKEKQSLLEKMGCSYYYEQSFDQAFSHMSAADFLERVILPHEKIKKIFLGYDFHFGARREGDYLFACKKLEGEEIEVISLEKWGEGVSSSDIRELIRNGKVDEAQEKLGRRYCLDGVVGSGKKRGRAIGFPTANLKWDLSRLLPETGVYFTEIELEDDELQPALTNIGYNPTFGRDGKHIESYILDFDKDIYEKKIKIHFHKKIREEMRFNGVEELKKQLVLDEKDARKYFEKI